MIQTLISIPEDEEEQLDSDAPEIANKAHVYDLNKETACDIMRFLANAAVYSHSEGGDLILRTDLGQYVILRVGTS